MICITFVNCNTIIVFFCPCRLAGHWTSSSLCVAFFVLDTYCLAMLINWRVGRFPKFVGLVSPCVYGSAGSCGMYIFLFVAYLLTADFEANWLCVSCNKKASASRLLLPACLLNASHLAWVTSLRLCWVYCFSSSAASGFFFINMRLRFGYYSLKTPPMRSLEPCFASF